MGFLTLQDLRTKLSSKATVMVSALRKFAKDQEQALVVMPEREAEARFRIVQILSTGVLASVLLAVLLAITFNRTTASRMSVLMDNTGKLARGQELNPLLEGEDEIGHLDQVFHEMADALADASRRKAELMSMVSHDLRTPLTSMQGSMTLLSAGIMGELTPNAAKEVSRAERNATRLINLINDLLDIEKLEAGRMDMAVANIALQPVFEESMESVVQFAASHSVSVNIEPTNLQVMADHNRLIQVLVNLLSNAIKFSPEGETVRLIAKEDGKMVEIQVIDRGRGVPEAHREATLNASSKLRRLMQLRKRNRAWFADLQTNCRKSVVGPSVFQVVLQVVPPMPVIPQKAAPSGSEFLKRQRTIRRN